MYLMLDWQKRYLRDFVMYIRIRNGFVNHLHGIIVSQHVEDRLRKMAQVLAIRLMACARL
jgi:hypothetical protein